ncbi:MAG: DUF2793 domain-containing protein [Novosphingobium sp.]|nr:DUF2793 domain-containing protein [Novosphingobium sp.]
MSDPLIFDDVSPRFGLPFLFAGQAQKEACVNEALALADALLHCAVEGTAAVVPAAPLDGQNWLVGNPAPAAWAGKEGTIACRQGGNWLFVQPRPGLRVLDLSAKQERRFDGTWKIPVAPAEPSGGSTVDTEARAALLSLIGALRTAGIFPGLS